METIGINEVVALIQQHAGEDNAVYVIAGMAMIGFRYLLGRIKKIEQEIRKK